MNKLKAPFPWFGGKSRVADQIWERFGPVTRYVEPFCGSAACLWARPDPQGAEIINDMDALLTNFMRSVRHDPDGVAEWADRPVNEVDMQAAHRWLCKQPEKSQFEEAMRHDLGLYDVKRAGLWVWGLSSWIGSGWCAGEYYGPENEKNRRKQVCNDGSKLPQVSRTRGINTVGRQLPIVTQTQGINTVNEKAQFMRQLAERLRHTMVCCGDWRRVVTPCVLDLGKTTTAVLLDPPYLYRTADGQTREKGCYTHDSADIAHEVREWALANGDNPKLRIALCGYEGEHDMPESWECLHWKAHGGMSNSSEKSKTQGINNRGRERIWFSPHCLKVDCLTQGDWN